MKPISFVGCLLFAGACNAPAPATIDATKASVDELRAAVPTRAALTIAPAATHKLDAPSACAALGPSSFGTLTHQIAGNADGVVGGVLGDRRRHHQIAAGRGRARPRGVGPDSVARAVTSSIGSRSRARRRRSSTSCSPASRRRPTNRRGAASSRASASPPMPRITPGRSRSTSTSCTRSTPTVDPIAGKVGRALRQRRRGARRDRGFAGIRARARRSRTTRNTRFRWRANQSAGLAFTTRVDFDGTAALDELAHIESRWAPTGAGVAHLDGHAAAASAAARPTPSSAGTPTLARVFFADSLGHTGRRLRLLPVTLTKRL